MGDDLRRTNTPRYEPEAPGNGVDRPLIPSSAPIGAKAWAPPPNAARAQLLLVDDSLVNQMLAAAMLAKAAALIDVAANGREAIAAVRAKDYDLILMDLAMPEMDGLEATRIIRGLPGGKGRMPIIAMTAQAMEADRERCFAAGMNDYVSKPVDRIVLLETVSRWLQTRGHIANIGSCPDR
ncbi:MAG TPA: response regulator [Alphaproteobacteria bacterium]|nr:response regulator [Alphaproteobacteria bacterium]